MHQHGDEVNQRKGTDKVVTRGKPTFFQLFLLLGGNSCLTLPPSTESLCPSFKGFLMIINHHRLFTLHMNSVM